MLLQDSVGAETEASLMAYLVFQILPGFQW